MLKTHVSQSSTPSSLLRQVPRKGGNVLWVNAVLKDDSENTASLLLIGGANLTHFRLRIAQSHVRRDLLPSFWSHVAIVDPRSRGSLHEVSVEPKLGFHNVPRSQGIQVGTLEAYDNPEVFTNIGILKWRLKEGSFAGKKPLAEALTDTIDKLYKDRSTVDIPSTLWSWLGYVWGVADQSNPLLRGVGVPSAVFVETVLSILGIDVTPGLASQASCPESIWQAAKWWGDFYDSPATLTDGRPNGSYFLGQPAAAVTVEDGEHRPPTPAARRRRSKA